LPHCLVRDDKVNTVKIGFEALKKPHQTRYLQHDLAISTQNSYG